MKTDILVIGTGIAGLSFALDASKYGHVTVVTKTKLHETNTFYAQGGLAGVFGHDDSLKSHIEDTKRAGDGLSNEKAVKILVQDAPKRILELKSLGVKFNLEKEKFSLSREAVHSRSRIVHSSDSTGKAIETALCSKIEQNKKIQIIENGIVFQLLTSKKASIGIRLLKNNKILNIFAKKTILATGGVGRLYSKTTNPVIATGDGIAMAFRAGVILEDMEFIQFHPTMLHNSDPTYLISETLRGEGGILKNKFDKSFMRKYHRDGDLAPRDVVAKFSMIEMRKNKTNNVWLDITHFEEAYIKKRFPNIYNECLKYNVDLAKNKIPVSPGAHYICGGIKTDFNGFTNLKNMYAIGECACTQVHGADRLASNSMTEGLVFGRRLLNKIKKNIKKDKLITKELPIINISNIKNGRITKLIKQLQKIMWEGAGIIRNKRGLAAALEKIEKIERKFIPIKKLGINYNSIELNNMILLSKIITISALRRKESRGTHFVQDYLDRHDNIWNKHLTIDRNHPKLNK